MREVFLLFFFIYVIINEGDKHMKSFIKMVLQIIYRLDYIFLYLFYRCTLPVIKKQVLFLSDSRETLTGNFYYIYEYIKDEYIIKKHLYKTSKQRHNKKNICKDMAQSQYILVDDFYPLIYPIPLRKETKLVQVWHAMGAFKTVGFARKQNHDYFSMTHRNYTDTIVSSEMIRKDYARAFRMNIKNVHSTGIPRTDVFFDEKYINNKKEELYNRYPFLKEKKVILFAPTFRGNNVHNGYYDYQKIDFIKFEQSLLDEYICIIKMHPFIKNKPNQDLPSCFFIDLTNEREINDLLFITDVLITDYSSVIFEAALLNLKTIFFAYDLEKYISERDFFYPYEEYTYGPVVYNDDELIQTIRNIQLDQDKLKIFKRKFVSSCDGHSTEKFVKKILKENR